MVSRKPRSAVDDFTPPRRRRPLRSRRVGAVAGTAAPRSPRRRAPAPAATWRPPAAYAPLAAPGRGAGARRRSPGRTSPRPTGLDLSLGNAVSVVAGLAAALAWLSGLLATHAGDRHRRAAGGRGGVAAAGADDERAPLPVRRPSRGRRSTSPSRWSRTRCSSSPRCRRCC